MPAPKFRLFGGPNGSGKTSLFRTFKEEGIIHTEIYVSADRIEADLHKTRKFWFIAYRVKADNKSFKEHILKSGLFQEKIRDKTFIDHFVIKSGVLHISNSVRVNSYHASFIASYLAEALFATGQSFAFETVIHTNPKLNCWSAHVIADIKHTCILFSQTRCRPMLLVCN